MQKKVLILILILVPLASILFFNSQIFKNDSTIEYTEIPIHTSLFQIIAPSSTLSLDQDTGIVTYEQAKYQLKPELSEVYSQIGFMDEDSKTTVIYPTFTQTAYSKNGFYDYYNSDCDESCLTVEIQDNFDGEYASSRAGYNVLQLLGYKSITDIDVDKDPTILEKYEILLCCIMNM